MVHSFFDSIDLISKTSDLESNQNQNQSVSTQSALFTHLKDAFCCVFIAIV